MLVTLVTATCISYNDRIYEGVRSQRCGFQMKNDSCCYHLIPWQWHVQPGHFSTLHYTLHYSQILLAHFYLTLTSLWFISPLFQSQSRLRPALLITFSCLSISSGTVLYQVCSHFLMSSTYSFLLAFLHSKHAHVSVIEEKKLLLPMTPFSFFSLPRGLRGDLTVSFSFVPQPPAI